MSSKKAFFYKEANEILTNKNPIGKVCLSKQLTVLSKSVKTIKLNKTIR